jgi:hypothetical protein
MRRLCTRSAAPPRAAPEPVRWPTPNRCRCLPTPTPSGVRLASTGLGPSVPSSSVTIRPARIASRHMRPTLSQRSGRALSPVPHCTCSLGLLGFVRLPELGRRQRPEAHRWSTVVEIARS